MFTHKTIFPPAIDYELRYTQKGMKYYTLKYIWDVDKIQTKELYDETNKLTGIERTTVKKTKSLEQKVQMIKGDNTKEILDGMYHFVNAYNSLNVSDGFKWKQFPNILELIVRQKYNEVLKEQTEELKSNGIDTYDPLKTDGSEWSIFKKRFLRKYINDTQAKETMIAAFETFYRKPDETDVDTHNSCCLLLESLVNQLDGARTTKLDETERLQLYIRTF